ncbi:MAG: hypothetical protein Q8903_00320 [Bacteroidota bacterium]|nr:hypothetical protein [Bacteroidota bacterium]
MRNNSLIIINLLYICLSIMTYGQTRGVFTSNTTSNTTWDSVSFGMLSRQVTVALDSEAANDTLWVSFSAKKPTASNSIMILSRFQGESITIPVQAKFIKSRGSALVKRRIVVW